MFEPIGGGVVGLDVRHAADSLLRRSPMQARSRRTAARRLAVLAYHGVDSPQGLSAQLDLIEREATPVSLDEVVASLDGGPALPERAVLLTFDDGHPSVLRHGLPLLRERGMTGVVYVVPGVVGTRRPFWWDEAQSLHRAGARASGAPEDEVLLVRWLKTVADERRQQVVEELRRDARGVVVEADQLAESDLLRLRDGGMVVGSHSWSHPCLDRCTAEESRRQVEQAHEALTRILGEAPTTFAYPNGNHDPRAESVLAGLGYRTAFLFDHRLAPATSRASPLRISRLRVSTTTPLHRFAIILSGLHPALHHARRRP